MIRGRACTLILIPLLAISGCAKKNESKGKATAGSEDRGTAPEARREAPREPARAARSAAEACAEGARPDHGVSKEQFEVTVKAPKAVKVGSAAEAEIVVTPKEGYKINLKYPTELALKTGSEGVSLPRSSFEKADAKELTVARLRYVAGFTATSAGTRVVRGELGFSVCTPKICITEPDFCVAWEVAAQ